MNSRREDSPTGTRDGLRNKCSLAAVAAGGLAVAAVGFVLWLGYDLTHYQEESNQVDTRPAALKTVQEAALLMDSATAAKRPYPTLQQMLAEAQVDWRGMEVTILSSDSRRRTYCIMALTVADHLIQDDAVRYYIHRPAGTPPEPRQRATITPCK